MQHVVRVTNFSTVSKLHPDSNFTELHTLTLAAHSYALLVTDSEYRVWTFRLHFLALLCVCNSAMRDHGTHHDYGKV